MWETSVDLYQYIQEQVQDVYDYVFSILGVEDPDEEFNAGTYVQGTAVVGYYAENGSSYVDTSFSYIMGTNMPAGSPIYNAPWGSCVTAAAPSNVNALVITPSTGAVTMNVPVTRTNFDDTVSLTAVQIGWNTNQRPLYNAQNRTTPYQGTGNWIGIQKQIASTNLSGASGQPYYTPLPTGTTTFNNYRQAVVIYVNNNNGSLDDITVDDVPTWQELTGEEPTEPTESTESGNIDFTLDYDEILSEQEFYDILSTETYHIAPLETDLYSLELQTVPPAEQLPEHLTLISGAVASEGVDIISDLGLSPIYTSLAVFTIICLILRGGR